MIEMVPSAHLEAVFQLLKLAHPRARLDKAHDLVDHQKPLRHLDKMVRGYGRPKHVASETRRPRAFKIEADQRVDTIELLMRDAK